MRALSICIALVAFTFHSACGRSVEIGRYPTDGGDASSDSGGSGGHSGDGGDSGHDECAEFEPVCGRDDVTYMNSCLAMRAGVSIAHRGPCS